MSAVGTAYPDAHGSRHFRCRTGEESLEVGLAFHDQAGIPGAVVVAQRGRWPLPRGVIASFYPKGSPDYCRERVPRYGPGTFLGFSTRR